MLGSVAPHISVLGGFNGHGMPRAFGAARMLVERVVLPELGSKAQSSSSSDNVDQTVSHSLNHESMKKSAHLSALEDEKMRLWNVERFLS